MWVKAVEPSTFTTFTQNTFAPILLLSLHLSSVIMFSFQA